MPEKRKLLIMGDSISLGVAELRINEIVGYVQPAYTDILRKDLLDVEIVIDADIHRTTSATLGVVDGLLSSHRPNAVLLMLGGNDADVEWRRFVISDGRIARSRVKLETYAANLEALARRVRNAGGLPVLTDMPNHNLATRGPYLSMLSGKDVTGMIAAGGGQETSDAGLQLYRNAAARVAQDLNCPFVAYGENLRHYPLEKMSGVDGVHPSAMAHQLIAQQLLPVLQAAIRPDPKRLQGTRA